MNTGTITITGGSGFVGRLLREGLGQRGYSIRVYDQWRGLLIDCLRHRYLGRCRGRAAHGLANQIRRGMRLTERLSVRARILRESGDDILEPRSRLVDRFRGSRAVIHLAALPHPFVPGMTATDFRVDRRNRAGGAGCLARRRTGPHQGGAGGAAGSQPRAPARIH